MLKRRLTQVVLLTEARDELSDSQANGQDNSDPNEAGGNDFNRSMNEATQPSETAGNARPQIPITPVRPRGLATKSTKDSDHKLASPSSMSPFVPGYSNIKSDGVAGIGSSQASSPSYPGYAGHLHHPKPDRKPLGPSAMSTAPTIPMAPMDEEELPALPALRIDSSYGNDNHGVPGQYAEVNSSPPIQMPQPVRQQSAIERQAASVGMSVQDLLNSSPAKQHPLPQAYQGSVDNDYGFQNGFQNNYNYQPSYMHGLDHGYGNSYSHNYTPNYGPAYGQGYNNGFQSYNQGYDSSPQGPSTGMQSYNQGFDSSPQGPNNGTQNFNQSYDSSPHVPSNGAQNYNQSYNTSSQGQNTGVQNYNQGYNSSPQLPQVRNGHEQYPARASSSNATRSARESEAHNNEHHGLSSDNNYHNSGSLTEEYGQLPAYNGPGPEKSMALA